MIWTCWRLISTPQLAKVVATSSESEHLNSETFGDPYFVLLSFWLADWVPDQACTYLFSQIIVFAYWGVCAMFNHFLEESGVQE